MNTFSTRLKELRKEHSLTQKSLAKELDTTDDCIYSWEKGRSEPSIAELIMLANYFEVSLDYLLGRLDI